MAWLATVLKGKPRSTGTPFASENGVDAMSALVSPLKWVKNWSKLIAVFGIR